MNIFNKIKRIHFIGIGGVGISAVARMMILGGKEISGSDVNESKITKELKNLGVKIYTGHKKENLESDTDLVIHTIAIPENNCELVKARKLKIEMLSYPEILGLISKNLYTIAISGTHGKTTTTAMTAKVFMDGQLNPTVTIGSLLKDLKSNFIAGDSKYFIVEACEYKRSFLNLQPKILAITNIDNDHLDYYKNLEDIQRGFSELVSKVPTDGFLVCNSNNPTVKPILKSARCRVVDYTKVNKKLQLKFPGIHNIENAKIAFAIGRITGIKEEKIIKSLENFSGTWRRFDFKGTTRNGALIYDDYAHHPTEIKTTLKSFKEKFPNRRLIVIFQPHLFSRTKILLRDFAESFNDVDEIVITPIYAAREKPDKTINSSILAEKIKCNGKTIKCFKNFDTLVNYLGTNTHKDDIVLTMGAGDIYKVGERLVS